MSDAQLNAPRPPNWRWYICGLLFLATMINYMDRMTLANTAIRIQNDFGINNEQYGDLEVVFGLAFAAGALFFGFLADYISVRWLYPCVLVLWSAVGFLTGLVENYDQLFYCRLMLGLFEAGHWPCALKTTQRILSNQQRTMGNSILQSGAIVGSILASIIVLLVVSTPFRNLWQSVSGLFGDSALGTIENPEAGAWRPAFQIIGVIGLAWVFLWLPSIRTEDLAAPPPGDDASSPPSSASPRPKDSAGMSFEMKLLFARRVIVLVIMVMAINTCWHFFRAWLPKYLQEARGYSENFALGFLVAFNVAADLGCIGAGAASLWLCRRGITVYSARSLIFLTCCGLTALSTAVALLPQSWLLLGILLLVGFGSLGLFPCYYSFSQELSFRHQGKITGMLGTCAWLTSILHKPFGRYVDQTGSYDLGVAIVGWLPLVAFVLLWLLWGKDKKVE